MINSTVLEFYDNFIKKFNADKLYNMLKSIENTLIISNTDNSKIANFWSIVLNQKFNCITTPISFSFINNSKLNVYDNIIILDEESESFIKNEKYNGNLIFINKILNEITNSFEKDNIPPVLSNVMLGLLVYYDENAIEIIKKVIYKVKSTNIEDIENYDVIVCNNLISCGIDLIDNKFNIINTLNYIDNYISKDKLLYISTHSKEDIDISKTLKNNSSIISCDFDDAIEQIVYGVIFNLMFRR